MELSSSASGPSLLLNLPSWAVRKGVPGGDAVLCWKSGCHSPVWRMLIVCFISTSVLSRAFSGLGGPMACSSVIPGTLLENIGQDVAANVSGEGDLYVQIRVVW